MGVVLYKGSTVVYNIKYRTGRNEDSKDSNHKYSCMVMVWFMVFNATFNNILVISWLSVLLVEETGVSGENHRHAASH
jgi:hypothetical protein